MLENLELLIGLLTHMTVSQAPVLVVSLVQSVKGHKITGQHKAFVTHHGFVGIGRF